jgi:hypothetical protein
MTKNVKSGSAIPRIKKQESENLSQEGRKKFLVAAEEQRQKFPGRSICGVYADTRSTLQEEEMRMGSAENFVAAEFTPGETLVGS